MEVNPKVTFVMPAYNAEKYIAEAIDSARRQTYSEWAMIIVDDCSTDGTYEIAMEYARKDSRITVLRTDRQSGSVWLPRKEAIEHARTELVSPLDADDYIEDNYLEKLLREKEKLYVQAIYPTMYRMAGDTCIPLMEKSLCGKSFIGKECVVLTLDGWRIDCGGGIIDKNLYMQTFEKCGVSLSCYKDEILTRYLLWYADNVAFSTAKYIYRENPDSITHKVSAKQFDFLINHRELLQFFIDRYGLWSEEHIRAAKQNFHGIADSIRLLLKGSYSEDARRYAKTQIRESYRQVDWKLLWRHDSKWYWFALRGGMRAGMIGMEILDALKSVKDRLK